MSNLVTVLAAAGALSWIGTLITAVAQRRKVQSEASKTGADAAKVLTTTAIDSAVTLMAELRRDLETARDEAEELRRDLAGTRRELEGTRRDLSMTRAQVDGTRGELADTRSELDALRVHLRHLEGMLQDHGVDVPKFRWPPMPPRTI